MNNMTTEEWRKLGISKSKAERIAEEVIEVMKKYNISLNQATVILDSVKKDLNNTPLWQITDLEGLIQENHEFVPSTSEGICTGPICTKPD